jgi:muramoyltetrapeptide carboxypeptidase LdcA involved in peptidoglycan recycling
MKINFSQATDVIKIIAPASRPHDENPQNLVQQGIDLLTSYGFKTEASNDILSETPTLFYANSLEARTKDLFDAIVDARVKIIWCLRGGYGSCEVANMLFDLKIKNPKVIIGFSDITSLHVFFNQFYNFPSIHSNNICSLLRNPESIVQIIDLLAGKASILNLLPLNNAAQNYALITGEVTGGNLKVLTTLIGTKLMPNFDGKILVLEDVNEPGYSIMRAMMQLKYAGLLNAVKAIIFGDFIKGDKYVAAALNFFSQQIAIPIFTTENFGHGEHNTPLILGSMGEIQDSSLTVASPFKLLI